MNIFFCPEILNGNNFLDKEESAHAVRVLRMKEGDALLIVDGKGGFYNAKITSANSNQCNFEILEKKENFSHDNGNNRVDEILRRTGCVVSWMLRKQHVRRVPRQW